MAVTNARQLIAYPGLLPSENSRNRRQFQGEITKDGAAGRTLIEAALGLSASGSDQSDVASAARGAAQINLHTAWKVQERLCRGYHKLL